MKNLTKNFVARPFNLTNIFNSIKSLEDDSREKLIVILGATASGKSSLGITLAEYLDSEIISADSMAVYKNFNIGTAKPTASELEKVPHHLINILDATERFSVGEFIRRAKPIISELNRRGKIPIIVGGTGLYIQALVEGYELSSEKSLVSHFKRTNKLVYNAKIFGLTMERAELYARINLRTEQMFKAGLVEEVRNLLANGISPKAQAMFGIGYKETVAHIIEGIPLDETIAAIAKATRNFAKRQLTWYRRMKYINWLKI